MDEVAQPLGRLLDRRLGREDRQRLVHLPADGVGGVLAVRDPLLAAAGEIGSGDAPPVLLGEKGEDVDGERRIHQRERPRGDLDRIALEEFRRLARRLARQPDRQVRLGGQRRFRTMKQLHDLGHLPPIEFGGAYPLGGRE